MHQSQQFGWRQVLGSSVAHRCWNVCRRVIFTMLVQSTDLHLSHHLFEACPMKEDAVGDGWERRRHRVKSWILAFH